MGLISRVSSRTYRSFDVDMVHFGNMEMPDNDTIWSLDAVGDKVGKRVDDLKQMGEDIVKLDLVEFGAWNALLCAWFVVNVLYERISNCEASSYEILNSNLTLNKHVL